jgi:hypothetical protein
VKRALLVAFHFPPYSGSSGVQRSIKFVKYLPEHGWEPLVLTAAPRAYTGTSDEQLGDIPPGTVVERAFALDARRHLAWRGRYFGFTALPDRWISWWPAAVLRGLALIRRYRPQVIWATYPIATAHVIGMTLARLSGLPLVADYRDAMVVDDFPEDPAQRRAFSSIERRVVRQASAAVFTTPSSREVYRARYPAESPDKLVCIRNGYDDADFAELPPRPAARAPGTPLRLLHSGLMKLSERDPRPFLAALAGLIADGAVGRSAVEVVFRAPGDEALHRRLVAEAGLEGVVRVAPRVGYAEAIAEMAAADALLVFQNAGCNHLVPAKLYEYIRARRSVLALTDHRGETADLLREAGAGVALDITSTAGIRAGLPGYLRELAAGTAPVAAESAVRRYSRRSQAGELAALLDRVAAAPARIAAAPGG